MTPEKLLIKISKILQDLKIPYIVTGGFAVVIWGKPRFTADIDIVIKLTGKNIKLLAKHLLAIDKNVYADEESMHNALIHKSEFNFIHPDTGIKVDFFVRGDNPYDKLEMKRVVLRDIYGQKVFFISPEDLILSKLIWFKEGNSQKQREDIKSVLRNTKIKLDFEYIKKWARKQGTDKILEKILKEIKK